MKTWRGAAWATALVVVGLSETAANASWCNAFEVCWHRQTQTTTAQYYAPPASVAYYVAPVTSYYAPPTTSCYTPPAPSCTPCQTCQTNYVQRSYYQPVTEYQSQSYYEKVTSYNTSYYYEPVTSYSYSSYYDASSCSYQQIAKPTVSYYLRTQNCPVDNWVQRCQKVPVTSYKIAYYYDPVTTCSSPPVVAAAPAPACSTCNDPPAQQAPVAPQPSYYPPTDTKWQAPPAPVSARARVRLERCPMTALIRQATTCPGHRAAPISRTGRVLLPERASSNCQLLLRLRRFTSIALCRLPAARSAARSYKPTGSRRRRRAWSSFMPIARRRERKSPPTAPGDFKLN